MELLDMQLCDIQGFLFSLSEKKGYGSAPFIELFMKSALAAKLDSSEQWKDEEALMEELLKEKKPKEGGKYYPPEVLFWIGYIYRSVQIARKIRSRDILRLAPPDAMYKKYAAWHMLDTAEVVDKICPVKKKK